MIEPQQLTTSSYHYHSLLVIASAQFAQLPCHPLYVTIPWEGQMIITLMFLFLFLVR